MNLPLLVFAEFLWVGGADSACAARLVNHSLELSAEEAGTTGNAGISLVVRYAEPFFHNAFSSFFPVTP
jgi:hypothetical protein